MPGVSAHTGGITAPCESHRARIYCSSTAYRHVSTIPGNRDYLLEIQMSLFPAKPLQVCS